MLSLTPNYSFYFAPNDESHFVIKSSSGGMALWRHSDSATFIDIDAFSLRVQDKRKLESGETVARLILTNETTKTSEERDIVLRLEEGQGTEEAA